MNKDKATHILRDYIQPDRGLYCLGHYLAWTPGDDEITLDCRFTVDELDAIVWWMKNRVNP